MKLKKPDDIIGYSAFFIYTNLTFPASLTEIITTFIGTVATKSAKKITFVNT